MNRNIKMKLDTILGVAEDVDDLYLDGHDCAERLLLSAVSTIRGEIGAHDTGNISWPSTHKKFGLGDKVLKFRGSRWKGRVVGFYSTELTPEGYAVESDTETGSVQIYPAAALTKANEV